MNAVDWTFAGIFVAGLVVIVVRGAYELGIIEGEHRIIRRNIDAIDEPEPASGDR